MPESFTPGPKLKSRMGKGGWLTAVILGGLFGVAVWFAFRGWNLVPDEMDARGYAIMAIGLAFLALLGGGLMALVFWSHKKGYDR